MRPRPTTGRGLHIALAAAFIAAIAAAAAFGSARHAASPVRRAGVPVVDLAAATAHSPSAHEADQGFALAASSGESVHSGPRCARGLPVRRYDIAAIRVDITLNRYLDHDPEGRMYALERDVPRVRAEEARNRAARAGRGEPAVTTGLQGDAIQPLTLRVNQGECLRLRLRNELGGKEAASIHMHGTSLRVAPEGGPAVATNPAAVARPGATVTYEWMVGTNEAEGTHVFHSHGDVRNQTAHGLFGAMIVEPAGSVWLDPRTGKPTPSGWDASIRTRGGAFREFTVMYHEVGDESYQMLDRNDQLVPLVDPITHSYRPNGRALNYRSEPFFNRLAQQPDRAHVDESVAYSSYAYGDPATPIMRSYLGEPVKQRLLHAGGEVFHVHHVHGGGIRWRRQPNTEPASAVGLAKHPPLVPAASERTDSQAIGPSETYDVEDECGAGGCQQSVGDFMYHCHVTEHYFSGMWGLWRVYNTRQDGPASTDTMPPLPPLARGTVASAVTSADLAGTTVDWNGQKHRVNDVRTWVRAQLPPPGIPAAGDASVWDWTFAGATALGEAETRRTWPDYRSPAPGRRRPILFDPRTGKPAFPFLRPHLNARPPFAPDHGPAPYLDPLHTGTDPPAPGANGPASVCPSGARPRSIAIDAIRVPIPLNEKRDLVDPAGELYVLHDQIGSVRAVPAKRLPLVLRANAGQDCLDVLLRSELTDDPDTPFSKVGAHIHFMQFDVQASDGVSSGFNYEQTIRPYEQAGTTVTAAVAPGARGIDVTSASSFRAGAVVGIGMGEQSTFESRRIASVADGRLVFDEALAHAHGRGEIVSAEFVRYRWYPDVQFGTAFFHDHVHVLYSGRHGLYGAIIVEPPGSSYRDPRSGGALESGPIADIHTASRLSPDVNGSFREMVMGIQDDNPLTHIGSSSGSAFGERVEPLEARIEESADTTQLFSSRAHGDPATPVFESYLGDPLAIRTLVGASNDVHSFHLDGHWFRTEPYSATSRPANTVNVGISERYDLFVPAAGGPQRMPGDYLYYSGRTFKLREGSWGIARVYGPADVAAGQTNGLQHLPGHAHVPTPASSVCPSNARHRHFKVSAVSVALPMLNSAAGKVYVLEQEREDVEAGRKPPEPLVLHANVRDCIHIALSNRTKDGPVSFHTDLLAADPARSAGVAAGREPDQSVEPGGTRSYVLYASPEIGPTTAMVRDWGDVLHNPGIGLYGAIVVGPQGAHYTDPVSGADADDASTWRVDVHPAVGAPWRDVTLFFQDEDASIGTHKMPYTVKVGGVVGINYQNAPLASRNEGVDDPASLFRGDGPAGMPATPLIEAYAGDAVHLHVLAPWSEQAQVFSIDGHTWPVEIGEQGTHHVSSTALVGLDALNLELDGGAGGPADVPGDYVYGDHREPYREAGLWGLLRVLPCGAKDASVRAITGCTKRSGTSVRTIGAGVLLAVAAVLTIVVTGRRRRRQRLHG